MNCSVCCFCFVISEGMIAMWTPSRIVCVHATLLGKNNGPALFSWNNEKYFNFPEPSKKEWFWVSLEKIYLTYIEYIHSSKCQKAVKYNIFYCISEIPNGKRKHHIRHLPVNILKRRTRSPCCRMKITHTASVVVLLDVRRGLVTCKKPGRNWSVNANNFR